ncbi:Group XVI phospholipase A2, partial [Ophiophagus hannah]
MGTKSFLNAINATSLFPVVEAFKFRVRKEKIKDVPGVLKVAVWNKFDEKYPPLDPVCVVKRARHMENKVLRYNPANANCEHFATLMRYDKALSDQVRPTSSPIGLSYFGPVQLQNLLGDLASNLDYL